MSSDFRKPNLISDPLRDFVQKHAANTPPAPFDEFENIQAGIRTENRAGVEAQRRSRNSWKAVMGGSLALFSFVLTLSLMPSPIWQSPIHSVVSENNAQGAMTDDELSDFLEDSLSALADDDREWEDHYENAMIL